MAVKEKCIICGNEDCVLGYDAKDNQYFVCPTCGKYIADNNNLSYFPKYGGKISASKLKAYLYYNKGDRCVYFGKLESYKEYKLDFPKNNAIFVTLEMIENWYPKEINDKIDLILLQLNKLSRFDGDKVKFTFDDLVLLCFAISDISSDEKLCRHHKLNQVEFVLETLVKMDYITWQYVNEDKLNFGNRFIRLTAKGLTRVYDLRKSNVQNKDVFVAMSFHESANDIRQAIKKGIDEAGYSSLLMDEIVHNHQIVPEMLRLIRESRFMIMDISQPNFGAYYEAGYAQGLGKEVIITCSQEVWDKKDFSCEKDKDCIYKQISTKPHFDIAQKQVLKWKDYKDLTKQLTEWIKHLIG